MDRNINDNIIKYEKLMGYYKEVGDKYLLIYEYTSKNIKYVTFENMSSLYSFQVKEKYFENLSNKPFTYNVSQIIIEPKEHQLLSFRYLCYYITTTKYSDFYDYYYFDQNTQILYVNESLNDWISFTFFFNGETNLAQTQISAYH